MSLQAIALMVLLLSCSSTWSQEEPLDITYCQLAKDPSAFMGKRIRIRGIYVHGFEVQLLKSPVCCPDRTPAVGVEWDADLDDRSEKLFRRLDKGMVVASAVFVGRLSHVSNVSSQLPSGDRFQLNVEKIDRVEKTAKANINKRYPKWVPINCQGASASKRG